MTTISERAFVLCILLSASLYAKGFTVKITIQGPGFLKPLEITSPDVAQFAIWAGPGVFGNGVEETEGFITDWKAGVVERLPDGLQRYEVAFYTGCDRNDYACRTREPQLTYVVSYAYDPASPQGYVYLPGRGDDAFRFNGAMYHGHDFEGH